MLKIGDSSINVRPKMEGFYPNKLQQGIVDTMIISREVYHYNNEDELITELKIRSSIVDAARSLAHSGIRFKVFRESMANPEYWHRTPEGGFKLKSDVDSAEAIIDIFRNGPMYGTECATAMVIVLYKAILDVIPRTQFNKLYSDIYLMDWKEVDRDLALLSYPSAADYLPGDGRYFKNPDVDPLKPEWQGENVYDLGGGMYYGHGIGIGDSGRFVNALNAKRKKDAQRSAYLMDIVKRQRYKSFAVLI